MNKFLFFVFSFFLIVLQFFVIDNLVMRNAFSSYLSPELYIYIIITLPFFYNPIWVMVIAFLLGILLDVISGTLGLHAIPLVMIGYVRNFFLKDMQIKEEREKKLLLTMHSMGRFYFLKYALIMIVIYHSAYFVLETFQFNLPWLLLLRIIFSSIVTFFVIFLFQFLPFYRE